MVTKDMKTYLKIVSKEMVDKGIMETIDGNMETVRLTDRAAKLVDYYVNEFALNDPKMREEFTDYAIKVGHGNEKLTIDTIRTGVSTYIAFRMLAEFYPGDLKKINELCDVLSGFIELLIKRSEMKEMMKEFLND